MLFSIIVPAYNAERYLPECLASVDAQTFRDYEVIIVDDGSTDETSCIADTYAQSKCNVTVLHRENEGPLLARRAGLKISRGQYAVFVDSDDGLHPEALQCIYDAIAGTDADIVSFRYCRSKNFGRSDTPSPLSTGLYSGKEITEGRKHLCEGRFNEMWGKAIRLNLFDPSADYTQYNKIKHGEDLLQLLPVFDKARSLCSLDDVLYFYRTNDTASTSAYKLRSYPTSGSSTAHCSNTRGNGENHAIKARVPARPCSTLTSSRLLCRGQNIAGSFKFSEMCGKRRRMRNVFPVGSAAV